MLNFHEERMSDAMVKYHIEGMPSAAVIHEFSAPDFGDPHTHPFSFVSTILHGSYIEEVYDRDEGLVGRIERMKGDSFVINANHIHRIVELPEGTCFTIIQPGPWVQKPGFYSFRDDGVYYRDWDAEWEKVE